MPTEPQVPQEAVDIIQATLRAGGTDRDSIRRALSAATPLIVRFNDRSQTRANSFVTPGAAVDAAMAAVDAGSGAESIALSAAPAIMARNTL